MDGTGNTMHPLCPLGKTSEMIVPNMMGMTFRL